MLPIGKPRFITLRARVICFMIEFCKHWFDVCKPAIQLARHLCIN